jgi:hypothetical protein
MSFGLIYWVLMLIWLVFEILPHVGYATPVVVSAGWILTFILFLLLGWKVFGAPARP